MKIYIDLEYRCHATNPDGTFREVETTFFDGKCAAFIECYRYVPEGESWTRSDGVVFHGEMIAPIKNCDIIFTIQTLFEEVDASISEKNKRIAALEEENAMLLECVLEMSEIVYA